MRALGRSDLAERVEVVSQTKGDGCGYDVLSFTEDGSEKYIEVKTTNGSKERPFLVTRNEIDCSNEFGDSYWLYRVFRSSGERRLFRVSGR